MKPLRLAADTNVLLDAAEEVEVVLDALDLIARRVPDAHWLVPPSVLEELAFLSDSAETLATRHSARRALRNLRESRRFRPLLELPFPAEEAEELAAEMRCRELVPRAEVHDSRILAESALLGCGILLSSDEHLRGVDHEALTFQLIPYGLQAPVIATPREIVHKFFR